MKKIKNKKITKLMGCSKNSTKRKTYSEKTHIKKEESQINNSMMI
jgi:hypothetical protein